MLQAWYNKQVVFLLFLRPGMEPFVEGCIEHQRFHESSSEASASGSEFAETQGFIHVMQDFFHQRYGGWT